MRYICIKCILALKKKDKSVAPLSNVLMENREFPWGPCNRAYQAIYRKVKH